MGAGPGTYASESLAQTLTPAIDMTAGRLAVRLSSPPGFGSTRSFTLRVNGFDTTVSCTLIDVQTECQNNIDTYPIPAGSLLSIRASSTGAPASTTVAFGLSLGG
jgi:hypothetical protein